MFIWHWMAPVARLEMSIYAALRGDYRQEKEHFLPLPIYMFSLSRFLLSGGVVLDNGERWFPKPWIGTLLVVAFIQSELQCIVHPNQPIRIECAGGCQKVSSADEKS